MITAIVFPGLTLNDSGEQPQILSGIYTGTSRTEKDQTCELRSFVLTEYYNIEMVQWS